jgi:hypothetical protein
MHTALRTAGAAAIMLGGAYGVADASTSYNGDDHSYDTGSYRYLVTCDRESDSVKVKGWYDFNTTGGANGSVTDGDGNNGVCASRNTGGTIRRHQTCEAPENWFDSCGNWQATSAK